MYNPGLCRCFITGNFSLDKREILSRLYFKGMHNMINKFVPSLLVLFVMNPVRALPVMECSILDHHTKCCCDTSGPEDMNDCCGGNHSQKKGNCCFFNDTGNNEATQNPEVRSLSADCHTSIYTDRRFEITQVELNSSVKCTSLSRSLPLIFPLRI